MRAFGFLETSALSLVWLAAGLLAPHQAVAQQAGTEEPSGDDNLSDFMDEIVVVATPFANSIQAPQAPVATFDEEDIAAYGVDSIAELLAIIEPQTGSGRGRGGDRPVMLLNGRRISNYREMRSIPSEAIRKLEVLPEEVALRYGYSPNQRVLNFVLKDSYSSRTLAANYGLPTDGGFYNAGVKGSLFRIQGDNRLNINLDLKDSSMLTESERAIMQTSGTLPTVAADPDPAQYRSLSSDTSDATMTASWAHGMGDALLSVNGTVGHSQSLSLSGLNAVELVAPNGDRAMRTLPGALVNRSQTDSAGLGAAFNKPIGDWELTLTLDSSIDETRQRIARRADTSSLVAAAAAGQLAINGALPDLASAGSDVAIARSSSLTSLVTMMGKPISLPAGDVQTTISAGYSYTGLDSRDTRVNTDKNHLARHNANAGINLGIPLTSRRNDVLSGIGDITLNLSAGFDRLSNFGTIYNWSAGVNWAITEKLGFQTSYLYNQAAPSLANLGNPGVERYNVPIYDFTMGQTALVTVITGGNPALIKEKQRDIKVGLNWQLPFFDRSNIVVEYFRNRSDNVTASFPVLTPAIEAAFPGRIIRDSAGNLLSVDRRPVTFAQTHDQHLRYGFQLRGVIGRAQEGEGGRGGAQQGGGRGGPRGMMGMGRPQLSQNQLRWNFAVYHTIRFVDTVLIAQGGPKLDLLKGDAVTGGGSVRNAIEFEGGGFYQNFGLRFNGSWSAPTTLKATGVPGGSDLRFGSLFTLDLRAFVNFKPEMSVVKQIPILNNARLAVSVKNVLNTYQKVTDSTGEIPLSYQRGFMDPQGRVIEVSLRKMF